MRTVHQKREGFGRGIVQVSADAPQQCSCTSGGASPSRT